MDDKLSRKLVEIISVEWKRQGYKSRNAWAKEIGINPNTLIDIELGRTNKIPSDYVLNACTFLKIDISKALNDDENYTAIDDNTLQEIQRDLKIIREKLDKHGELFFDELEARKKQIDKSEGKEIEENEN